MKSGITNNHQIARAIALYWINDQRDTAKKYYKELLSKYPDFTLDMLRKKQDIMSLAKETKDLLQNAFKEVEVSAKD